MGYTSEQATMEDEMPRTVSQIEGMARARTMAKEAREMIFDDQIVDVLTSQPERCRLMGISSRTDWYDDSPQWTVTIKVAYKGRRVRSVGKGENEGDAYDEAIVNLSNRLLELNS